MTFYQAAILGALQGATEFLPISSSGHLVLAQNALGLTGSQLLFDLFVHVGTVIAVVVVFRARIISIVQALAAFAAGSRTQEVKREMRLLAGMVLALIPTCILALAVKKLVPQAFSSVRIVGIMFLVTAAILFSTRWIPKGRSRSAGFGGMTVVGVAQGIAALPALSRSGATISAALWLGWDPAAAAEFSFLISIPAVLGGAVWELKDSVGSLGLVSGVLGPMLLGMIIAAVVGYLALTLLIGLLKRGAFWAFGFYCASIGVAALIWSLSVKF